MQLDKKNLVELAELISKAVVEALEKKGLLENAQSKTRLSKKSAYAKTEALLYNYRGFKRIIAEKKAEIEDIRVHGVPMNCGDLAVERVQGGSVQKGIVLPEESVEAAVRSIERSVQSIVRIVNTIDSAMNALRRDPYFNILEMQYFEERTQEEIAVKYKCAQATISRNRSRLVKELAIRIFPDQAVNEMLN